MKKDGKPKSALVVSPTHAEAARITLAIRAGLKTQGKLDDERMVQVWTPTHLTDDQKSDATQYEPGDLLQFQQNAPGHTKGSRLIVRDGGRPPTELANRFEATPGLVEHGLFPCEFVDTILVARGSDVAVRVIRHVARGSGSSAKACRRECDRDV